MASASLPSSRMARCRPSSAVTAIRKDVAVSRNRERLPAVSRAQETLRVRRRAQSPSMAMRLLDSNSYKAECTPLTARTLRRGERHTVAYVVFDVLLDGDETLVDRGAARAASARAPVVEPPVPHVLRISENRCPESTKSFSPRLRAHGWEGVITTRNAIYGPGRDARALGWSFSRSSSVRSSSLVASRTRETHDSTSRRLLAYCDDDAGNLVYAGHTGGGFYPRFVR